MRAGTMSEARLAATIAKTTVVRIPDRCSRSARSQIPNVPQNCRITAVETSETCELMERTPRAAMKPSTMLPAVTSSSMGMMFQPITAPPAIAPTAAIDSRVHSHH